MTAPSGSIITVQLTLDERTGVTLWAPPWTDEDGEEWQGFLGDGAKIIMFPNVDELFEYIATSDENDLSDHPGWPAITKLTPAQLRPAEDNRYDLEGVYEWAAGDPDPATESSLANVVEMVLRIGEACDDGALRRLIGATPEYADLMNGDEGYTGREGRQGLERARRRHRRHLGTRAAPGGPVAGMARGLPRGRRARRTRPE